MHTYVEDVSPLVLEANRLLFLAADIDLLQATEFADSVVNVHHKIAGLQAHELLDRQRLLVLLEAVLEPEPVVTLENLVVCVDGEFESHIHKALAEFCGDGLVLDLIATVGENVVQTLELSALARHHERGITVLVSVLQMLGEEIEVLVEARLILVPKVHGQPVRKRRAAAKLNHPEAFQTALESQSCGVQFTRPKRLSLPCAPVVECLRLFDLLVELVDHTTDVPHPGHAVLPEELQKRLALLLEQLIAHIGDNHRPVHLAHTQLVRRIEFPDAIHLISEELDAIRMVESKAEDVHDASTNGILTGFVDIFHLLKTVVDENVIEEVLTDAVAPLDGIGVAFKLLSGRHLLGHRFGEADDAHFSAQRTDLAHDLRPHGHIGIVRPLLLVRHPGTSRVEQHLVAFVAQQVFEVVHEIRRAFLVFEQEQVVTAMTPDHLGREKTAGRTHQPPRLHFGPRVFQGIRDLSGPGIVVVKSEEVLQGHDVRREDNRHHALWFAPLRCSAAHFSGFSQDSACSMRCQAPSFRTSRHERMAAAHLPNLGGFPRGAGAAHRQAPRVDFIRRRQQGPSPDPPRWRVQEDQSRPCRYAGPPRNRCARAVHGAHDQAHF